MSVRAPLLVSSTVLLFGTWMVAGCAGAAGDSTDVDNAEEQCELFRLGEVRISSAPVLSESLTFDVWRAVARLRVDRSSLCIQPGEDSVKIVLFVDSVENRAHARATLESRTIYLSGSSVSTASESWLDAILRHEFAHVALEAQVSHLALPTWYSEGYANYVGQSVSCTDSATAFVEIALAAADENPEKPDSSALSLLQHGNRLATASAYEFTLETAKRDASSFHKEVRWFGFEGALHETTSGYQASLLAAWAQRFSAQRVGLKAIPQCR